MTQPTAREPDPTAREPDRLFTPMVAVALVAASLVSAALFLVLTAYAPELGNPADGRAHALSKSAVGYAGLAELLRLDGMTATVSHDPRPGDGARPASVFVLTPEITSAHAPDKSVLLAPGERLIAPPKWITAPSPFHQGWVVKLAVYAPVIADKMLLRPLMGQAWPMTSRPAPSRPVLFGRGGPFLEQVRIPLGRIDSFRTFAALPEGWVPALADEQGRTVLAEKIDSPTYVLSDPDILNNQGLADPDNAKAALFLLHSLPATGQAQPVVFDVTLNGFARSRDVLRLIFEPPFLAATLCLLGAALLMGLHAAVRFGAPTPPPRALAFGKRALAETSAALIRMVGREPAMAPRYAALIRDWTAHRLGLSRNQNEAAMDAALDRIGRQRTAEDPYSLLATDARGVRDEAALMRSAKRMHRWRLEMTRGRN